jgi:hypothetical protein
VLLTKEDHATPSIRYLEDEVWRGLDPCQIRLSHLCDIGYGDRAFQHEERSVRKRILLSVLWAILLPAICFVGSMLMFGILGLLGFQKWAPSPEHRLGWFVFGPVAFTWAWLSMLSPITGFTLAFFGYLPGTRSPAKV